MIFQKVVIFITLSYVATTLAGAVNQNKDLPLKPSALDLSLFNFMARSASIMQKNPSRSASCTDYYLPLIECIIREYEQNGKACNDDAAAKRAAVEAETEENQANLADSADSACGDVVLCKELESAESILQCYVDEVSSKN